MLSSPVGIVKGNFLLFERIRGFLLLKFGVSLELWITQKSCGKEHECHYYSDADMFRLGTVYCNGASIYP